MGIVKNGGDGKPSKDWFGRDAEGWRNHVTNADQAVHTNVSNAPALKVGGICESS
jgi:hypothetical protein